MSRHGVLNSWSSVDNRDSSSGGSDRCSGDNTRDDKIAMSVSVTVMVVSRIVNTQHTAVCGVRVWYVVCLGQGKEDESKEESFAESHVYYYL